MSVTVDNLEWRSVIRFCVLLLYDNNTILGLLQHAYKGKAPSVSSVRKWALRFRNGCESVLDSPRPGRPPKSEGLAGKILDQLDVQPFASLRVLADSLDVPRETLRQSLINDLGYSKYKSRWIPHKLSEGQKSERVEISQIMLRQLKNKRHIDFVTADESIVYHEHYQDGQWAESPGDVTGRVIQALTPKKTMIIVMWGIRGFHIVEYLPAGEKFTGDYAAALVGRFDSAMRTVRGKTGARGMALHWDNARSHRSAKAVEAIREVGMIQMPHPPYSPDISPTDFFLFGEIKRQLKGKTFRDSNELLAGIAAITDSINRETREKVFENWIRRLEYVIGSGGEYVVN